MTTRIAVMGFRHGHIMGLVDRVAARPDAVIVACCEEHAETREAMNRAGKYRVEYDDFTTMLKSVACDAVAVGDYYGRRGSVLIEALRSGKHVIGDKPLCTSLAELGKIERLARDKGLSVGCMLDLRSNGNYRALRQVVRGGAVGEVHAVSFNGQHPLMHGTRASWYFERGKHGGTINDIAIHALDAIPWITGLSFASIDAARAWNARLKEVPHFQDGAQMMLTMSNGAGVLGDVSYLAPDSFGYSLPHYWRMTVWGSGGVAECHIAGNGVSVYVNGEKEVRVDPPAPGKGGEYLDSFLAETRGERDGLDLTSAEVLASARLALRVQDAADRGLAHVRLGRRAGRGRAKG